MKVRLTRKLAECIDGVDLSRRRVGDVFDLTQRDAALLLAHGWASPLKAQQEMAAPSTRPFAISLPLTEDEEPS